MTDQPPKTAAELARDCHALIAKLERSRLNVAQLRRARSMLLLLCEYKATRASLSDRREPSR